MVSKEQRSMHIVIKFISRRSGRGGRYGGSVGRSSRIGERKNLFIENYIMTYIDTIGGNVKALVTFMSGTITKKHTFD
jgi:hypothetical protein